MRGKLEDKMRVYIESRITPADAGKTVYRRDSLHLRKDHPRGCGENSRNAPVANSVRGSPPRMRGKRTPKKTQIQMDRITPADAGKTVRSRERMD